MRCLVKLPHAIFSASGGTRGLDSSIPQLFEHIKTKILKTISTRIYLYSFKVPYCPATIFFDVFRRAQIGAKTH